MSDPGEEDELLEATTGSSTETESTDMVAGELDATAIDFLAHKLNTKKAKLLEEEEGDIIIEAPHADDLQYQDNPRMRICRFCGREFKSDKALGGHLRIHSQQYPKPNPKSGAGNMRKKHARKHPAEEDNGFLCFGCPESFSSMKLLCQHMRNNHRENGSKFNGSIQKQKQKQQPTPSQETHSESDQTIVQEEEEINQNQVPCKDLLKHISNRSKTGKRSAGINVENIIYDAVPLRAYYQFLDPDNYETERRHEDSQTTKKLKTEEAMSNHDYYAPMESQSLAAYAQVSLSSVSTMPQGFESHPPKYKIKFISSQGRLKKPNKHSKSKKAVKSVHQCEICGKMFETGQALGGHKSYHRVKPDIVDPFRGMLVQRKAKEKSSGETQQVSDGFSVILMPGESSAKAEQSEESYEECRPKRLLDFDLNLPYVE